MRQAYRTTGRRWSVGLVHAAERMANVGDLSLFGELCEALLTDDRIPGILRTRTHALLGTRMDFVFGSERARNALSDEDAWKIAPTSTLNEIMLWGLLSNAAPVRRVWDTKGRRDIPKLEMWKPWGLRFNLVTGSIDIDTDKGLRPFTGRQWSMFSPFGGATPWKYGLARGLARWFLLKQYAIDDWGRHSENASRLVATESDEANGSERDARQQLAEDIAEAGKEQIIILPKGFDLKLVEATANTRDIYDAQIAAANTAFSVAGLGHNLTSEIGSKGSYSAADIGNEVRNDLRHFDDEALSSYLHDNAYADYVAANFPGDAVPWPAWQISAPRDKKAGADALTSLANSLSIFRNAEAPIDVEAILEAFDVPMLGRTRADRRRSRS